MTLFDNIDALARIAEDQAERLNKITALIGGLRRAIEYEDKDRAAFFLDQISRIAAGEAA